VGDPGVAEPGQVGDCHPRALLVVDRDRGEAVVRRQPVHEHHRHVRRGRVGQELTVQGRGGQHEPVDVPGPHLLEQVRSRLASASVLPSSAT
jgi:hypothetical protein